MLDPQAVRRYHDQGFLVLPDAFPEASLAPVREAITRQVAAFDPSDHQGVFSTLDRDEGRDERFLQSAESVSSFLEADALDDDGRLTTAPERAINKIGHALHDHIAELGDFCRQPFIGEVLRSLGHEQPELWQSMVIFKQPQIGGEVRWHQDATYLYSTPPSVIGLWVALEDASADNGCLLVQPGGHRGPLRERYRVDWHSRKGQLEALDATPWPAPEDVLALEVPAGGAVLFSDHLPHASAANRSGRSRTALSLHFADASSGWDTDNWLQRPNLPRFRV